jgi:hypothetical protein
MGFLACLLGVMAWVLWRQAHQPLAPLGLVCWAAALYVAGWLLYTLWEEAGLPLPSRRGRGRIS